MRFWQRIGALLLNRVLRCHHKERLIKLMRRAANGHAALLHCFKHGALRLWCGAIDFVSQHNLCKERPLAKLKVATGWRFHHDGGAGDIGRHEIRRKLNAPKFQLQRLRQTAN